MTLSVVRYVLIGLGLLFFLLAFLSFKNDVGPLSFERIPDIVMGIGDVNWDLFLFFVVIGYLLFTIGLYWKSLFKKLASLSVFFSVFFITFAIFLYPVNLNSEEIADSIQPTIDYMAADSFGDIFGTQVEVYDESVNLILAENSEVMRIHVANITDSQAAYLTSQLGMRLSTSEERVAVSKMIITSIFHEIQTNSPELEGVPIPLSQVNEMASAEVDMSSIESVDVSVLESVFEFDQSAFIDILVSEGTESVSVVPSRITSEEVNMLWDELEFNPETSFESRKNIIVLLLSASANQMQEEMPGAQVTIPVEMVKHSMPEDVVYMMGTEIMSDNISMRVDAITDLREYCSDKNPEESYACAGIMLTDYENLIKALNGIDDSEMGEAIEMAGISPEDMMLGSGFDLEGFSTIEEVEEKVDSMSSPAVKFFFIAIGFLVVAGVFLYFNFKVNSKFFGKFEIFYQVSKMNFLGYVPTFVFILVIWYLVGSEVIFNFIGSLVETIGMDGDTVAIFKELPIYDVILDINSQVLVLAMLYFVFSLLLFGILYFLDRKYPSLEELQGNESSSLSWNSKPVAKRLETEKSVDVKNKKTDKDEKDEKKSSDLDKDEDLEPQEKKARKYIEKYRNDYSSEALKKALVSAGMPEGDVARYIEKYS